MQAYFNCTIQELKQLGITKYRMNRITFQLHHTGIKTHSSSIRNFRGRFISIAPYRN